VFGTQSGPTPETLQEYVEVGLFDTTGASSFAVDTFAPLPLANTGAGGLAGLDVVTGPQGTPVLLSTIGGGLTAAIGPSAAGGAWSLENAVAAPTDGRGWLLGGAGVEAGGAIDVLLQGATSSNVAHRDPGGAWTTSPLAYTIDPAAIAVDATGKVYTAGWVDANGGAAQLEVTVGSGAPIVLATGATTDVGQVEITVGRNADGSPLPVVAYGSTLTLAVPDGKGGFTKVQPTLTVAQSYADTCGDANGLSLGNCTCVATCGQTGDSVNDVELVRDAQGDVYIAWLEVDTNYTYPVDKSTTSVVGQTVTCTCTPDLSNGSGEVSAVGLELERLVMTPTPHTEHRGTIPVPPHIGSVLAADGNGTLQLLISSDETSGTIALRRVVFDASKMP
jgi:hypothetical protein